MANIDEGTLDPMEAAELLRRVFYFTEYSDLSDLVPEHLGTASWERWRQVKYCIHTLMFPGPPREGYPESSSSRYPATEAFERLKRFLVLAVWSAADIAKVNMTFVERLGPRRAAELAMKVLFENPYPTSDDSRFR
jgi:hypothetical protein